MTLKELLDVPPYQPKPPQNDGTDWLAVAGLSIVVIIALVLIIACLARAIFGVPA